MFKNKDIDHETKFLLVCAVIIAALLSIIAVNSFKIHEQNKKMLENQKELLTLQITGL